MISISSRTDFIFGRTYVFCVSHDCGDRERLLEGGAIYDIEEWPASAFWICALR